MKTKIIVELKPKECEILFNDLKTFMQTSNLNPITYALFHRIRGGFGCYDSEVEE